MCPSAVTEKRQSRRHGCVAEIEWSYIDRSAFHDARILNFSRSGIYLETRLALKPGTTIWIRVNQRLHGGVASDASECLPTVVVADTKWCQDLSGPDATLYGIGLRYQFPMV